MSQVHPPYKTSLPYRKLRPVEEAGAVDPRDEIRACSVKTWTDLEVPICQDAAHDDLVSGLQRETR